MHRLLTACLLLVTVATCPALGVAASTGSHEAKPVHDFRLPTMAGDTLQLSEAMGERATVLLFWASWNSRSVDALREYQELYGRYAKDGLQVIAVNVDNEGQSERRRTAMASALSASLGDAAQSFTTVVDTELDAYAAYGVKAVPSFVLLNEEGRVEEFVGGYAPDARAALRNRIERTLKGGEVAPKKQLAPREQPPVETRVARSANSLLQLGDARAQRATVNQLSRVVATDPSNREACRLLGGLLADLGREPESQRVYGHLAYLETR